MNLLVNLLAKQLAKMIDDEVNCGTPPQQQEFLSDMLELMDLLKDHIDKRYLELDFDDTIAQ